MGYYSAALKLVTIWAMIPTSYMTASFPALSLAYKESREKGIRLQNNSLKYMLALALPLTLGISLTAAPVIRLLYGADFSASAGVLRILSWYLPLVFCNMLLWRVLVVRDQQALVFKVQLVTELLQAGLALWLTIPLGFYGAAIALLGGNVAYTACLIYFVWRDRIPLPIAQLGWRFGLASLVMAAFTWFFAPRIHLFLLIAGAALIYVLMVWVLRAFSAEELAVLRQMLRLPVRLPKVKSPVVGS